MWHQVLLDSSIFMAHAGEDKAVARQLAIKLQGHQINVWLDEFELRVGDSIRRKIEKGLSQAGFGVVILSRSFFRKEYAQRELDALFNLELTSPSRVERDPSTTMVRGEVRMFPVRHDISAAEVVQRAPLIGDRFSLSTDDGLDRVAKTLVTAIRDQARRLGAEVLWGHGMNCKRCGHHLRVAADDLDGSLAFACDECGARTPLPAPH